MFLERIQVTVLSCSDQIQTSQNRKLTGKVVVMAKRSKRSSGRKRTGIDASAQQKHNTTERTRATKRSKRLVIDTPVEVDESQMGQSAEAKRVRKFHTREVPPQLRPYSFKPGHSGNPKGSRKGRLSLTKKLRKLLEQPAYANDKDGQTKGDVIVEMAVQAAAQGDSKFFQEIMNRIDGKVSDHLIIDTAKEMVQREAADVSAKVVEVAFEIVDKYIGDESEAAAFVQELGTTLIQRLGVPLLEEGKAS
jgi:hypothetical protein